MLGFILFFILASMLRESTIFGVFIKTTSNMHSAMCERVLRANILFFDANPIGRILTRFSKDMAVLDLVAPAISIITTYGIFRAITVTISLVIINYWLLIPAAIALGYLFYLLKYA